MRTLKGLALPILLLILLPASDAVAQSRSVRVGAQTPALDLPAHAGGTVALADLRASGPVVVVFYRGWVGYW